MQIDTVAMMQGVYDARDNGQISEQFANDVRNTILAISYPGPVGRSVCDYEHLLSALAVIEPGEGVLPEFRALELGLLWQRLGQSLSSGLSVAN